jgi:hypothetical protein
MGVIAGNIIAAIPAVQLAVKREIDRGLYVVMATIISGESIEANHAIAEVVISDITTAFWTLSIVAEAYMLMDIKF